MSRRADVVSAMAGYPGPAVQEHGFGVGPAFAPGALPAAGPAQSEVGPPHRRRAWALQSYLPLGALPEAVPCARLHARLVVQEWGLPELADTVELLVSELVTNAVLASADLDGSWFGGRRAAGRPPIRLWLQSDRSFVLISVWDGNDGAPQRQAPLPDEEHGRGLLLVESLSEECGIYRMEGATGKMVWARVTS